MALRHIVWSTDHEDCNVALSRKLLKKIHSHHIVWRANNSLELTKVISSDEES